VNAAEQASHNGELMHAVEAGSVFNVRFEDIRVTELTFGLPVLGDSLHQRALHGLIMKRPKNCTSEPVGSEFGRSNHEASLLVIEKLFGWVSDSASLLRALAEQPAAVSP
jgi:hypothetical protein